MLECGFFEDGHWIILIPFTNKFFLLGNGGCGGRFWRRKGIDRASKDGKHYKCSARISHGAKCAGLVVYCDKQSRTKNAHCPVRIGECQRCDEMIHFSRD